MKHRGLRGLFLGALGPVALLAAFGCSCSCSEAPPEVGKAGPPPAAAVQTPPTTQGDVVTAHEQTGPGPVPVDVFQPDRAKPATPAYGGRVIIHLSTMPKHLQRTTENSAVVDWIWDAVHDQLAFQDWENWNMKPRLATGWETEDTLVLKPEAAAKYGPAAVEIGSGERAHKVVYGKVSLTDAGYAVSALSAGNPTGQGLSVAADDVASVELGTVFTFHLRDGVVWHDGHPFDADDVLYSWKVFQNPKVDCDQIRLYFTRILHGEVLDRLTVRFFYEKQYFLAEQQVCEMPLLARHIYDLTDPDCSAYTADARPTDEDLAERVNNNPANNMWIGLGPYRVTKFEPTEFIEAERFDRYYDHDPQWSGYVDTIRWRYINDDEAAFQALINGELDYFDRIKSEDYFGERTKQSVFTDNYYKGYLWTGQYGYTGWNMLQPKLSDKRVRHALAHAFDMQNWLATKYKGLGKIVTGPESYFSAGYDHSVEPLAYDPAKAQELLAEAGWYDRDGDGVVDKDGIPLEIEFLYPSGNDASRDFGIAYQEALGKVGVKLELRNLEWATFLERVLDRKFDSINLAWVPLLENDPEQLWLSDGGKPGVRSSNHSGVMDPKVDEYIRAIQRELDPEKRSQIEHEFHRYIYDLQPYLFMINPPKKFAMNKALRGHQCFMISPGYDPRRWYYPEGTPGTRPSPALTQGTPTKPK